MQPERNYTKWAMETPKDFSFYRKSISRNDRTYERRDSFSTFDEMFDVYKQSILPLIEASKLKRFYFNIHHGLIVKRRM